MNNQVILYHGTTRESADILMQNGWQPSVWSQGSHCGQTKFLYLTNEPENALWYSQEKGEHIVLNVIVNIKDLKVDPEDGICDSLEEELKLNVGNLVLTTSLEASNFSINPISKLDVTKMQP
jgi:hypothetical protein